MWFQYTGIIFVLSVLRILIINITRGHDILFFSGFRCDGEEDCGDGSDEDILTTCAHVQCLSNQFRQVLHVETIAR